MTFHGALIAARRGARFSTHAVYLLTESLPASRIVAYHLFNGSLFERRFPMRLEVFCEDRLGLTRELLDLLVLRSIDFTRGIEIDPTLGGIYLNFAELEFTDFSSLMAEIRRISGVTECMPFWMLPSNVNASG